MIELKEVNLEQLFVPESDLTKYASMDERDLYIEFMKTTFGYQGKRNSDNDVMAPFRGIYIPASDNSKTTTDKSLQLQDGLDQITRVQTSIVDDAYAGVGAPWGPNSKVTLSTVHDDVIVALSTVAQQENEELVVFAQSKIINPLNQEELEVENIVPPCWMGNVENVDAEHISRTFIIEKAFREITPEEKMTIGINIEALDRAKAISN